MRVMRTRSVATLILWDIQNTRGIEHVSPSRKERGGGAARGAAPHTFMPRT